MGSEGRDTVPSREGNGALFTWGTGRRGRLGHGLTFTSSEESKILPTQVYTLSKQSITHVTCGKDCTAAVADNGVMYVWGSCKFGKLGLGPSFRGVSVVLPTVNKFMSGRVVCKVSAGRNHMFGITGAPPPV
jgi:alpha-tubulin suppressor-like RCC1 family protein